MALTTLSFVKSALGLSLSDTTKDPQLNILMLAADRAVKTYTGRDFESTTYTEYLTGNGKRLLPLRHRPVSSVTSVNFDQGGKFGTSSDPFNSSTLLTSGTDYALEYDGVWGGSAVSFSGLLVRYTQTWAELDREWNWHKLFFDSGPARGNIKVVYVAGYNPIPDDVQYAVAFLVSSMRKNISLGGTVESETIGDYSYKLRFPSKNEYEEIGVVRQLLSRYREISV